MRYKTVGEVIEFSRELHQALSRQYAELEQLTTSERASLILDYLNRHEQHLAKTLAQYKQDTTNGVLATWLQSAPEFHPEVLAAKVRDVDLNSVDHIVEAALSVDDYLVSLYRGMAEKAEVAGVREVFEGLLTMEDSQRHRIARNACRLNDL